MNERLKRIELLLGAEKVARLSNSYVTIVGVGAVGGFALESLARSGVGRFSLVDFDVIEQSNINRQLFALGSTVGRPKVEVACERVLDINPSCRVEPRKVFAHTDSFDSIFEQRPDLVIDAIDSFNPKVELLAYLQKHNIPVISSMGAALRRDPSCIRVGNLTDATVCPLAKLIRKHLRRRGAGTDLTCVYSVEPRAELALPGEEKKDEFTELCIERGRKRRELGSLPTITGIFGLTIANKSIELLTE
ncbi:MAG: tRNA threonylcarbamoyladenosine dehydratase [Sedimentisphaerales bacterium]|nr:tRNA threonylcarbamoyladenosine dehydratase [Sedimentisphaerales bacterium]MBN2843768.1 tRNA threonylcarbamoyladenosine dehydratase [Sedimentisphaerales bacterium]